MRHEILTLVSKNCITLTDSQYVYELVHPESLTNKPVELDFIRVEIFTAPFFNFSVGQLLRDIQPETLNCLLKVSNLNQVGKQILFNSGVAGFNYTVGWLKPPYPWTISKEKICTT